MFFDPCDSLASLEHRTGGVGHNENISAFGVAGDAGAAPGQHLLMPDFAQFASTLLLARIRGLPAGARIADITFS